MLQAGGKGWGLLWISTIRRQMCWKQVHAKICYKQRAESENLPVFPWKKLTFQCVCVCVLLLLLFVCLDHERLFDTSQDVCFIFVQLVKIPLAASIATELSVMANSDHRGRPKKESQMGLGEGLWAHVEHGSPQMWVCAALTKGLRAWATLVLSKLLTTGLT